MPPSYKGSPEEKEKKKKTYLLRVLSNQLANDLEASAELTMHISSISETGVIIKIHYLKLWSFDMSYYKAFEWY